MSVVDDVVFYLRHIYSYSHFFHGGDDPIIRNDGVCSNDDSRGFVFLIG